ncbi:hypothetical protein Lal_00041098 [Lupinus albus]|nr:hypothetical protein Lal_00041098 [Lupinus albus]
MSSQNEVNEKGTMVNTQTPIAQQTPVTPKTQKRKSCGVTAMKSVVHSRSNNIKSTASIDVGKEHKDYIMKTTGKTLREFRTNYGKCLKDAEGNVNLKPPTKYANIIDEADWIEFATYRTEDEKFLKMSEQNRKRASNPIYPYRASRMGYRGVEEKILEQSETPLPLSVAVDLGALWVTLKEKENFLTTDSQDQYYLLSERFQEMEKRMESGKFVEGPEASTTVQESFTHPRNHIPIPEVSVDISIEDDALLPIPADDITTVREVVGTFMTWPEHLIDVVPIMGKVSDDDHSATSPSRIDEHASKKAQVVKSKPQSSKYNLESSGEVPPPPHSMINISIPEPIYGFSGQEFITINEVKDVHGRDWIGASVISMYIRYLYDNFVPNGKKKVMFISPHTNILGVGIVTNDTWKNQQSQDVAKILKGNNVDLFFAPLNTGALNIYRGLNTKRQRPLKWTHVKTPCQNNNTFLYYIDVDTYTIDQIDVNREICSKFVYSFRTESTDNL